ncbi:MAG: hypothetical protein ACPG31_01265 [Planctomycetota bacterium]
MRPETTSTFQEDYHDCLGSLRGALTDLLSGAGVLNARPQEIAREFKLNKNLAWKVSKLVHETPDHSTLSFIPGPSGFQIFLEALGTRGVPASQVTAADHAFQTFQEMVVRHAGDRPTLQLLLDSMALQEGDSSRLEESRRLAFQGNSGLLGIQANVRFSSFFFAPNPEDPTMLDKAFIGGLLGLRRFRPDASWVLLRHSAQDGEGNDVPVTGRIPLDPRFNGPGPSLLGDYTSSPTPEVRVRKVNHVEFFELAKGPIGNTGIGDVCFGHFNLLDVPRYKAPGDEDGQLHLYLGSPVETLVFDLFLHKDMEIPSPPTSELSLDFHHVDGSHYVDELPLSSAPRQLRGASPSVATPLIQNYGGMADLVWGRLGWKPQDFRAWRMEVKFPPIPGTLTMKFGLEEAP